MMQKIWKFPRDVLSTHIRKFLTDFIDVIIPRPPFKLQLVALLCLVFVVIDFFKVRNMIQSVTYFSSINYIKSINICKK